MLLLLLLSIGAAADLRVAREVTREAEPMIYRIVYYYLEEIG